ncbi:hypothetical protein CC2G_000079 [Coprinopsis cinerea AmutBmut pab1-1]|nr:hypothetical protein CC2G_000079 [Coprinopsis cinerea AmutBmut pab1-1]
MQTVTGTGNFYGNDPPNSRHGAFQPTVYQPSQPYPSSGSHPASAAIEEQAHLSRADANPKYSRIRRFFKGRREEPTGAYDPSSTAPISAAELSNVLTDTESLGRYPAMGYPPSSNIATGGHTIPIHAHSHRPPPSSDSTGYRRLPDRHDGHDDGRPDGRQIAHGVMKNPSRDPPDRDPSSSSSSDSGRARTPVDAAYGSLAPPTKHSSDEYRQQYEAVAGEVHPPPYEEFAITPSHSSSKSHSSSARRTTYSNPTQYSPSTRNDPRHARSSRRVLTRRSSSQPPSLAQTQYGYPQSHQSSVPSQTQHYQFPGYQQQYPQPTAYPLQTSYSTHSDNRPPSRSLLRSLGFGMRRRSSSHPPSLHNPQPTLAPNYHVQPPPSSTRSRRSSHSSHHGYQPSVAHYPPTSGPSTHSHHSSHSPYHPPSIISIHSQTPSAVPSYRNRASSLSTSTAHSAHGTEFRDAWRAGVYGTPQAPPSIVASDRSRRSRTSNRSRTSDRDRDRHRDRERDKDRESRQSHSEHRSSRSGSDYERGRSRPRSSSTSKASITSLAPSRKLSNASTIVGSTTSNGFRARHREDVDPPILTSGPMPQAIPKSDPRPSDPTPITYSRSDSHHLHSQHVPPFNPFASTPSSTSKLKKERPRSWNPPSAMASGHAKSSSTAEKHPRFKLPRDDSYIGIPGETYKGYRVSNEGRYGIVAPGEPVHPRHRIPEDGSIYSRPPPTPPPHPRPFELKPWRYGLPYAATAGGQMGAVYPPI